MHFFQLLPLLLHISKELKLGRMNACSPLFICKIATLEKKGTHNLLHLLAKWFYVFLYPYVSPRCRHRRRCHHHCCRLVSAHVKFILEETVSIQDEWAKLLSIKNRSHSPDQLMILWTHKMWGATSSCHHQITTTFANGSCSNKFPPKNMNDLLFEFGFHIFVLKFN